MKVNRNKKSFYKFDRAFPLHTWYPFFSAEKVSNDFKVVFDSIKIEDITKRALYFHIPFCEERFCAFCSFNRKLKESDLEIQNYVDALIKEIELKSSFKGMSGAPIQAIFVGGGTPSVLSVAQILEIGEAIHKNFNLSELKEFSFENNICSVTEEKLIALKKIGVTHVRVGVQTLNQKYRDYFNLRPTIEEITEKIELLKKHYDNVCIDIIYGINGQTIDELIKDIHDACQLDTKLIDFYPLTQPKGNMQLYKLFTEKGLVPHTELTLIGFKSLLREVARQYGYIPHNGHGFVNKNYIENYDDTKKITSEYVFEYHKCAMGYTGGEVIGFGAGAVSGLQQYIMANENNIKKYIECINRKELPTQIFVANSEANSSKGIISHLPYFGYLEKKFINWNSVPNETREALLNLVNVGLIIETDEAYRMTADAWAWDNEIMYYLTPDSAKEELNASFANRFSEDFYKLIDF